MRQPNRPKSNANFYAHCVTAQLFVVSRSLAQGTVINSQQPGWRDRLRLPTDLANVFGTDLERFDLAIRTRITDLLCHLLTLEAKVCHKKNLWHTVASHIARRAYTNADLRWLKEEAGYYLVQDTEDGEAVFRLFHQTFADYLRDLTRHEAVENSFTKALDSLVPSTPSGIDRWDQATEPYLLNFF